MAYLNKVLLIGNTGKDPEFTVTQTGRKRASFSLATTKRYRDANGEQKEQTDWHNLIAWGKQQMSSNPSEYIRACPSSSKAPSPTAPGMTRMDKNVTPLTLLSKRSNSSVVDGLTPVTNSLPKHIANRRSRRILNHLSKCLSNHLSALCTRHRDKLRTKPLHNQKWMMTSRSKPLFANLIQLTVITVSYSIRFSL